MVALRMWVEGTSRKSCPGTSPGRHQLCPSSACISISVPKAHIPRRESLMPPPGRPPWVTHQDNSIEGEPLSKTAGVLYEKKREGTLGSKDHRGPIHQ